MTYSNRVAEKKFLQSIVAIISENMSVVNKIFIFLASLILSTNSTSVHKKRIINGINVKPGEIPHQVSLQYRMISLHFCGGSIINDYHVLTAAHCIRERLLEDIDVVAGTTNLDQPKWTYHVISTYVHEKYKIPSHFANDIALLKIDGPFKFNEFVSSVQLPKAHEAIPYHRTALASGWGLTSALNTDESTVLMKVDVTLVEQTYCSELYDKIQRPVYPVQFCTHDVGPVRKSVCTGDSGGPITVNNTLIGITSWSHKDPECGSPKYPDVHTRVSEFIDWINELTL